MKPAGRSLLPGPLLGSSVLLAPPLGIEQGALLRLLLAVLGVLLTVLGPVQLDGSQGDIGLLCNS